MEPIEIRPGIYWIEVPLPNTPLRCTNSYFIPGKDRDLLIDTGFNHPQCLEAMTVALEGLGVDMARVDLFATHMHSDHTGLMGSLAQKGARLFMSGEDGRIAASGREAAFSDELKRFFVLTGLRDGGHVSSVDQHPGYDYAPPALDGIIHLEDGDKFSAGDSTFRCVLTKGHTRGHLCLFDPERRFLFSGDHILGTITPNITVTAFDRDALEEFLLSLDIVDRLDPAVVFPGHRGIVTEVRVRTEELRRHHARRLDEVMRIVGDRRLSTVDVAGEMRWSLTIRDWRDYPPAQKMFSAGEALAHLHHLVRRGRLALEWEEGSVAYFRRKG